MALVLAISQVSACALAINGCRASAWYRKNCKYQETVCGYTDTEKRVYSLMYLRPRNSTMVMMMDGTHCYVAEISNNLVGSGFNNINHRFAAARKMTSFPAIVDLSEVVDGDAGSYLYRKHYTDDTRMDMVVIPRIRIFWYVVVIRGQPALYVRRGDPKLIQKEALIGASQTIAACANDVGAACSLIQIGASYRTTTTMKRYLAESEFHSSSYQLITLHLMD